MMSQLRGTSPEEWEVGKRPLGGDPAFRERLHSTDLPEMQPNAPGTPDVVRVNMRRRKYEQRVEAILQAGVDTGEFRAIDPKLTAYAWLGMHNYTYLWLRAGGAVSARDVP